MVNFYLLILGKNIYYAACISDLVIGLVNVVAAVVSGWGNLKYGGRQPDILQKVTVKVLENNKCGRYDPSEITANMMCAAKKGKDSCHGDSGGPLVTKVGKLIYSLISSLIH